MKYVYSNFGSAVFKMAECKRKRLPGKFSSKGRSSESLRMRQLNGKDKQINDKNIIKEHSYVAKDLRSRCQDDIKVCHSLAFQTISRRSVYIKNNMS